MRKLNSVFLFLIIQYSLYFLYLVLLMSSLIGLNKGNIVNIELLKREKHYLTFSFDLQIKDLKNFTNLISQIKQSNLKFKIIRHKQKKNAFIRRIFENFKRN